MVRKREYNKRMKYQAILAASEEIFYQKPYRSITVDEIAKLAGVSKKTLYTYFPSKLALLTKIFEEYLQKLNKDCLEILEKGLPPDEATYQLFQYLYEFTKENKKFMRIFWTLDTAEFNGDIPSDLVQSIHLWNRNMIDQSIRVIKQGQAEGTIAEFDPELIVHALSAINKGIFIHVNKEAILNIADVRTDNLNKLIWKLISKGLFPKRS